MASSIIIWENHPPTLPSLSPSLPPLQVVGSRGKPSLAHSPGDRKATRRRNKEKEGRRERRRRRKRRRRGRGRRGKRSTRGGEFRRRGDG